MSAIIAVLNKQAVALAADSAETIGGIKQTKIFNRANKIFTLSKHHPVGVMVYNSASFMHTPWETIIKVYRKHLGDKSFKTLKEYQEDFIDFIKSKSCFTDEETQKEALYYFCHSIVPPIIKDIVSVNRNLAINRTEENTNALIGLIISKIEEVTGLVVSQNQFCPEFVDYPYEEFRAFVHDPFSAFIDNSFTAQGYFLTENQIDSVLQLIYHYLRAKENYTLYSGLVFVGYGEDEIYPRLYPVNFSLFIQNRLRYYLDDANVAVINNKNDGAVVTFAQQDVMHTILMGIDDNLKACYTDNFKKTLLRQKQDITAIVEASDPALAEQIRNMDDQLYVNEFYQKNEDAIFEEYIMPLFSAVSQLSKEDLSEMAESMIYLTYLKRRITFAEESVGGAVDVAVISKGDGFIWIKRKLYFDAKLNEQFFDNYLNK